MSRPTPLEVSRAFRWADTFQSLDWDPSGPVNLGRTIVDRHVGGNRPALRWIGKGGASRTYTFEELSRLSTQFCNWLRGRGVAEGDRVAGFLPRIPETLAIMLGTWKAGGVYVPIFTGFGPDAIDLRVRHSEARVLCTQWEHRSRIPPSLPEGVTIVTVAGSDPAPPGDVSYREVVGGQPESGKLAERWRDDPAVLLYTSGSTGLPKGVQIATNFVAAVHPWMVYGVDLQPDDVFWPTGDPGWGYGLVCYMVALAMGVAVTCNEASPSPEYCLERLSKDGVTNFATTPTVLRGIMALPPKNLGRAPARLRRVSTCGEPLNAEVATFFQKHWNVTVMDHYGASEFGLPVGNAGALEMKVRPGSMGLPFPGCTMAIVDDEGREVEEGVVGHIGMRPDRDGYYSLGYWRDEARWGEIHRGEWMTIGDLGRRDGNGYFWFEGRADDVIKSAGYRIGPFEVESAMLRHPAVAEAAVVGRPDQLRGQIVTAFVVLKPGQRPYPGLPEEIVEIVKTRVGRHQYPRAVEFVAELPKTETGKIQRFLLRTPPTSPAKEQS